VILNTVGVLALAPGMVLAQAAGDDTSTTNPLVSLLPFILIGAVFYFLAIRPQRKRSETLRQFQKELAVGDEVRTAGGIIGVISSLSDSEAMIDVGGVKLKLARGAIAAHAGDDSE
jgi:preprotein translocase subunit YajC